MSVTTAIDGCGAPDQAASLPASVDLARETVISGVVRARGDVVSGAYVRLLDSTGEFAAEVVASPEGQFRFFAAPGSWTIRALSRLGNGESVVDVDRGLTEVSLEVVD
jgi:Protein of unknown function (DUF1416)